MKTKHTPGPWKMRTGKLRSPGSPTFVWVDAADGDIVPWRGFDFLGRKKSEHRANARLIAAAPDLLEALQIARDYACAADAEPEDLAMIDAAITKAVGKQPNAALTGHRPKE